MADKPPTIAVYREHRMHRGKATVDEHHAFEAATQGRNNLFNSVPVRRPDGAP